MDGIDKTSANAAAPLSLIRAGGGHLQRADSRRIWGEWRGSGPGGRRRGTIGAEEALGCGAYLLLAWAVCTVNALSILHDVARSGGSIPTWQPWVTEYTSLAGAIIALPAGIMAARFARASHRRFVQAMIVVPASVAFSLIHIGAMVALRILIWRAQSETYRFDLGAEWFYEYRKDALSFAVLFLFLLLARRLSPLPRGALVEGGPVRVLLADGRRGIEVDPGDLRAVRGGGNYVELIFAGDRRRLIRSTLEATEAALAGHGFRRTHKSWLVRLSLVGTVERTEAGDFRLRLDDQFVVPLSRRSRAVLAEVRSQLDGPLLL